MPDLVLSISMTGSSDHPRYIIADPGSRFWTGDGWTGEESEARLYVSVNDPGRAIEEILLTKHGDKPVRRYIVPVHVDLYSEANLSENEIREWLTRAARLTIDPELTDAAMVSTCMRSSVDGGNPAGA